MKYTEYKQPCPVCGQMVGVGKLLNYHISQMARRERDSNLYQEKRHHNYKIQHENPTSNNK